MQENLRVRVASKFFCGTSNESLIRSSFENLLWYFLEKFGDEVDWLCWYSKLRDSIVNAGSFPRCEVDKSNDLYVSIEYLSTPE